MPTYAYRCLLCAHEFEIKQSFHDDAITKCPIENCDGEPRRRIGPVGVIFKGSGWYVNDYGKKNNNLSESGKSSTENSSQGSNEGSSSSTVDTSSSSNSSDKNTVSGSTKNS